MDIQKSLDSADLKRDLELLLIGRTMWVVMGKNPGMDKKGYLEKLNSPEVSALLGKTQCAGCVIASRERAVISKEISTRLFLCVCCPLLTAKEKEAVKSHGFGCCNGDYHRWNTASIIARHTRAIKLIRKKIADAEKSK
jgi:hypothetical protein